MISVGEMVAVDVDVIELIVQSNFLGLAICLQQRTPVPQADVLNCVSVFRHLGLRKIRECGVFRLTNSLQVESPASEIDVVLQIWSFQLQLIGLDEKFLHEGRKQENACSIQNYICATSCCDESEIRAEYTGNKDTAQQNGRRNHDPQGDSGNIPGRISGTVNDAE
jgi:hypothetical protein